METKNKAVKQIEEVIQKTSFKSNFRIINLSNTEDINAFNFGEYTSMYNKWIDYGMNNDYPSFLRTLLISSPTHQAIVEGVINLATGEGVGLVDPASNPISNTFINKNFSKKVIKKLIGDLKINAWCVLRIFGEGNIVEYDDVIKYRMSPDKDCKTIWYCDNWDLAYTGIENRPIELPIWQPGIDADMSIMIYQLDKKGFKYYAPVDYAGSINYITLEAEIAKFHLSGIKNGLFPSFIIEYSGAKLSNEQLDEIEADIERKFVGSSKVGKFMLLNSPIVDGVKVTTLDQPDLDKQYEFFSKECTEKILLGHGITSPLLFGVRDTGGGLGSNAQELEQAFYLFYEQKLKHYQNYILELIEKVMRANYLYAEVRFKTYNPFANTQKTQELSKKEDITEINSLNTLKKIDSIAVKDENLIVLNENLFDGIKKENCLYKFMRSSNSENVIIHKFMILDKQGYTFRFDPKIIKNTKDYYFIEQDIVKK